MERHETAATLRDAIVDTGRTLARLPGREVRSGVHEVKELGPSLRNALLRARPGNLHVALEEPTNMTNWNRPTSKVDVVGYELGGATAFVAELKAWDIGHQLFDLAKVCCLLAGGAPAGFLVCVAKREGDFDRLAGGELFSATEGESREHHFPRLIARHRAEWKHHVGKNRPEPTSVPSLVSTTSVSPGTELEAYPGHTMRAVEVAVVDPTPVPLRSGWPEGL